jgi:OOP family OmpA-OmpF porin
MHRHSVDRPEGGSMKRLLPAVKRLLPAATLLALAAVTLPAAAQTPPSSGFYLGAGIADASFSVTDDGACRDYYYGDCETWSRDGDSDTGWTATAGWRFNRWFALEAGYLDAGQPGWDDYYVYVPELNGAYDVAADVKLRAADLSAVAMLPFLDVWDVYVKAGVARYDAESRQRVVDVATGRSFRRTFEHSDTTATFAIGGGVTFAERLRARLEVRGMPVDRDLLVEPSGDALLLVVDLQLQYRF